MTLISFKDGHPVLRDGKIGADANCCNCGCSGSCSYTEDCAPGCACYFGECIKCGGCLTPSNCTLTAVIEWSDNTTETLTYPDTGRNLGGFLFGPCLIGYSYGDVNGNTGIKSYYMECEQCCDDGTGKNCVIGALREETYDTIDPSFDYATSITITLDCDPAAPDPCNPFP